MKNDPSVKYEEKVFNLSNGDIFYEMHKSTGVDTSRIFQSVIRAEDLIGIGWTPPGKFKISASEELIKENQQLILDNDELTMTIQENNVDLQELKKSPAPNKLQEQVEKLNETNLHLREDISTLNETLTKAQDKHARFKLNIIDLVRKAPHNDDTDARVIDPVRINPLSDEEIEALTTPGPHNFPG